MIARLGALCLALLCATPAAAWPSITPGPFGQPLMALSGAAVTADTTYQSTLGLNGLTPQYPIVEGTKGWTAAMGSVCHTGMDYSWRTAAGGRHRFEIHNTAFDQGCDADAGSQKRRAELHRKTSVPFGVSMWGAFQIKDAWSDPAGMKAKSYPGTWMQMHWPSGASPSFAIRRIGNGNLRITTRGDGQSNMTRYTGTIPPAFNAPHDVVYRFKIGSAGELDVWLDGKQILTFRGPVGPNANGSYFCFGPYFASGVTGSVVEEFANLAYPGTADLSARVASPPAF